jgi:uncharacterized oxidoreductase
VPIIASSALFDLARSLFKAAGLPEEEASLVARSLVDSNLRGHDSHGVLRIPQYIGFLERGEYQIGAPLTIEHETPALVVCDAGWGLGQVQAHRLLDHILPKSAALGVASGTMRNSGHIGRLGEYAERAAGEGMILLSTVNNCGAGQRVAPPGGTEPRLGTNPLCIGVPTDSPGAPIVLDFGTSVVAEGKVRLYHANQKPVPEGWLLDHHGQPTRDPSVLYQTPRGSILPLGGTQSYKGFGLAFVLDLLAGGLSGGNCSSPGSPPARGNDVFFIALAPSHFTGLDALREKATRLSAYVRSTPTVAEEQPILLPGDVERNTYEKRITEGIPLEEAQWGQLAELSQRLGVALPDPGSTSRP